MDLMSEYIRKGLSGVGLENELLRLINEYNKNRNTYLFVYCTAMNKSIPDAFLNQPDYYIFHDMLKNKNEGKSVDIYIETPGGNAETAEDIVKFLRSEFNTVSFVVSGEAKSAGTIMVLSGDEILMTETGSLGPVDAQVRIGRSTVSAYDYIEWVEEKRKEATTTKSLNPVDATMIAQITPGEFGNVYNALKFAEDLVTSWLSKYKFKNWNETETKKIEVTQEMKEERAKEIARKLTNHSRWRSHGRSIKTQDLEEIGVKITTVDQDKKLRNIVYRIQTVCRLLFDSTSTYKIFANAENKIFKNATPVGALSLPKKEDIKSVQVEHKCEKCGKVHKIYGKFVKDAVIDKELKDMGFLPFPKDMKLTCDCGFIIDLSGIKNEIEINMNKKII